MSRPITNIFTIINSTISPSELLAMQGLKPARRMKCPIHGGEGENFALHGDSWTCFSRHCGEPHARDTVNLYCLMRNGRSWPNLDTSERAEIIKFFSTIVDFGDEKKRPVSRIRRYATEPEEIAMRMFLRGETTISGIAEIQAPGRLLQKFRLFFSMAGDGEEQRAQFVKYVKIPWIMEELTK